MKAFSIGLKGRVKASVVNDGQVVFETPWFRNLWLDQGLNQIASTPICDCFAVAVKGTGTGATSEAPAGTNTYTIANGTTTLTRAAGTRDFTADDVGRLIQLATGAEFTITAFTDATHVEVFPAAAATATAQAATAIYYVEQVALEEEVGRTSVYSATAGENKTVTVDEVRTFTRTFLFPVEDTLLETVPSTNTYSQATTTVTRVSGTRDFTVDDVGSTIHFLTSGLTAEITAFTDASHVTVGVSQTNAAQAITLTKDNSEKVEEVDGANTYARSGSTVTRSTGTRDFTADDVGKIIHFTDDDVEAIITVFTDAATVTVDASGTLAAQTITLYGFTDYSEVGFSHSEETDANINIRVVLGSPVRVRVATGLRSSDQLKLTYECDLTVSPTTAITTSLASIINDPGNLMSGNKNGKWTIESFATSTVLSNGDTSISFPDLEPFFEGSAALSLDSAALAPLTNKVRSSGTASVSMTGDTYVPGTFYRTFQAFFGLNEAISNNWRSLMIFDPDSQAAIFTFLYDVVQKKDGDHTFNVTFKKSWNRDLS